VSGRALTAEGAIAAGATVTVVPEPTRGRAAAYRSGSTDEYGVFVLRGVPPGRYTVFTYYEEAPCDYYDDGALLTCRAFGKTVDVAESGQSNVEVRTPPGY